MFSIGLPGGGEALPVFSFEEEAEIFLGLSEPGRGWRVRKTTAGELVSLLFGPCRGIGRVALDPVAEFDARALLPLVSVRRERFVRSLLGTPGAISPPVRGYRHGRGEGIAGRNGS